MADAVTADTQVDVEVDGRILSGVGADPDVLADAMERHEPEAPPADAPSAPVEAPSDQPKESRGRRRFADLTRERDEAAQRASALEKERDEWKAKASQAPTVPAPAASPVARKEPSSPGASAGETRGKPTEDEVGTKYKTYAEFAEDLADWKYEQREAARDARIADERFQSHINEVFTKGKQAYPDFEQVRTSGPGAQIPFHPDRRNAIVSHPAAEHLLYVIAKDQPLAQKLATCHPMEFWQELARLTPNGPGASPASPSVSGSVAPVPYQPVGASTKTTGTSSSDLAKRALDDYDSSGFREKRRSENEAFARRR
jgi:hypothetical protein